MKRTLFLVAATAAVLALPATASAFRGVAVAKDQARHSVVVAAKGGVVRTVRAPGRLGSIRLGHRVVYSARRLADGTFRATDIRSTVPARRAMLRGVVVRNQPRRHRLLLTAGGTVLSVRAPSRGFASNRGPGAGDRVEVRVRIRGNGLNAISITRQSEREKLPIDAKIMISPALKGPARRIAAAARCSSRSRPVSSCRRSCPATRSS